MITTLNPQVINQGYANDFVKVGNAYTSYDPRLISAFHNGQRLMLNTIPADQSIKMKDIYTNPYAPNFQARTYNNYKNVAAGDITYYVDSSVDVPLFAPVYTKTAIISVDDYVDPMGTPKTHYIRTPLTRDNPITNRAKQYYSTGLSFLEDTNEFREDLMNRQNQIRLGNSYTTGELRSP